MLFLAAIGSDVDGAVVGTVIYEQVPIDTQTNSRNSNGLTNQESNQQVADDFMVPAGTEMRVSGFEFWFTYTTNDPVPVQQELSIRIFGDVGGDPGGLLYERAVTFAPIATGMTNDDNRDIFTGEINIGNNGLDLEADTRYWLSPIGLVDEVPWSWQFHDDDNGERRTRYGARPDDPTWRPFSGDFAYRIYAIPEPGSLLLLSLGGLVAALRRRR